MSSPDQASPADHARWIVNEVTPHEPAVRGYLHRQFPSLDADDVVQESYLKLLKTTGAARADSARAYFFTVARNTALRIFHRRRIYSPVPVNELPAWRVVDGGPDAAEIADTQHRLDLAVEAIDRLPRRCRQIFALAALQRLPAGEIAAQLGLAESTVHVQMARGLRKCAAYLRARGEAA